MFSLDTEPLAAREAALVGMPFGDLLTRYLKRFGALPREFERLLQRAVLRLLDSSMLIEDSLVPFPPLADAGRATPLPESPHIAVIEATLQAIRQEGLVPHFRTLVSGFGAILLTSRGDDEQRRQVSEWTESGLTGAFFMSDRGGPSMQKNWLTTYTPHPDGDQLVMNKVWCIGGMDCSFAYVAARQPGALSPALLLLPPEVCAAFRREKAGPAYLDGTLQLGNVAGSFVLPPGSVLAGNSSLGVKHFLTLVRPRFVRALCSHVGWLNRQGRLRLNDVHASAIEHLDIVAKAMCDANELTRYSEDEVMALKFASNELLFDIVDSGAVTSVADQRDLLGFTKMEGSSYRCLFEIYQRNRGGRRVK